MTSPSDRPDDHRPARRPAPDAAHLDEDPEAVEDPVHSGDARHQYELHQRAATDDDS